MADTLREALRWRKKPVVIEAIQWTGENLAALVDWGCPASILPASDMQSLIIGTLEDGPNCEAVHVATLGDWIIRGVKGEFYPCKPDIFTATYERAALSALQGQSPLFLARQAARHALQFLRDPTHQGDGHLDECIAGLERILETEPKEVVPDVSVPLVTLPGVESGSGLSLSQLISDWTMLWREYGQAEEGTLTQDAIELKRQLIALRDLVVAGSEDTGLLDWILAEIAKGTWSPAFIAWMTETMRDRDSIRVAIAEEKGGTGK